ncbi:hypothetical protein Tco_0612922, partial [Tanacetum coccineum]
GGGGGEWRVRESDGGDWIDRVVGKLFGVGRKSSPENFSGGCGGGRRLPDIWEGERDQASTSGTQTDKALVYDSDGSVELAKEKTTVSFIHEEKKPLKSDFKTRDDGLLEKQIQLEKKIKELDNILVKMGQSIQTSKFMLAVYRGAWRRVVCRGSGRSGMEGSLFGLRRICPPEKFSGGDEWWPTAGVYFFSGPASVVEKMDSHCGKRKFQTYEESDVFERYLELYARNVRARSPANLPQAANVNILGPMYNEVISSMSVHTNDTSSSHTQGKRGMDCLQYVDADNMISQRELRYLRMQTTDTIIQQLYVSMLSQFDGL